MSRVYLTSITHVKPVWRRMRRDVWYNTHVEMYINHQKKSINVVEWLVWYPHICLTQATTMFIETWKNTCKYIIPDVDCMWCMLWLWLEGFQRGFMIPYLSWAWSNQSRCCVCLGNIYKYPLSGKGHSFHTGHPLITCRKKKEKNQKHWLILSDM